MKDEVIPPVTRRWRVDTSCSLPTKSANHYSKFLNGCQSGSACPWRVGTCQWRVDGDRRLSDWLDLLGAIRKIERRLNCVNVRSAFSQWEKRRNPSSTWNYVSTRKQQNTLQLPTIKKFAVRNLLWEICCKTAYFSIFRSDVRKFLWQPFVELHRQT